MRARGKLDRRMVMAQVIEFYIPEGFRRKQKKWTPAEERGKVITFPEVTKKSA